MKSFQSGDIYANLNKEVKRLKEENRIHAKEKKLLIERVGLLSKRKDVGSMEDDVRRLET